MRSLVIPAALGAVLLFSSRPALADDPKPDGAVAIVVGAATLFATFAVGATLVAASGENPAKNEAGWLTIEGGFIVAPFAAHGAVAEWGRGALFASVPAATTIGSAAVFAIDQDTVGSGNISQQAVMWGCFVAGLATSIAGVVDAAFAPGRAVRVAPMMGPHQGGLVLGGTL
jgi:hypothetical protein